MRKPTFLSVALAIATCGCGLIVGQSAKAHDPVDVSKFLYQGQVHQGTVDLTKRLQESPSDDNRMGLGTLQFFDAIEFLSQQFYQIGKTDTWLGVLPFMQIDVPSNNQPRTITYPEFRGVIQQFGEKLKLAEKTLSEVKDPKVRLQLDLARIGLDIDGDGKVAENERLMKLARMRFRDIENVATLPVDFDQSDAIWLQGYCNLGIAFSEFLLALDFEPSWDIIANSFFPAAKIKYNFREQGSSPSYDLFLDAIAAVHQLDMKVIDRDSLLSARQHLLKMVELSRQNWAAIQAEDDNEREWLPGPKQKGFFPRARVDQIQIATWFSVLDEWQAILEGKKLIKFWRGNNASRGINLDKVLRQIDSIDPILWVHGSAVVPYLETGEVSKPETWARFQRVFQGDFVGFAVWFN